MEYELNIHYNNGSINNLEDNKSRFDTNGHTTGHELKDILDVVQ